MWRDIALANRKNLSRSVDAFVAELKKFQTALKRSDAKAVEKFFATAKAAPRQLVRVSGFNLHRNEFLDGRFPTSSKSSRSAKPVRAEITVPGSKSITNRALILAALADGETILKGALWSEDTQIMVECLQELGFMVNVEPDPAEICNRTITVYGNGGAVPPGGTEAQPLDLFVGNAGTAARFLAPFLCLGSGVYRLRGVPRMHERPQAALFSALRELGYRVESEKGNDKLPVKIFGGTAGQSPESRRNSSAQTIRRCQTMPRQHRGKFAVCVGAAAVGEDWRLGN